jgi:two-component system NtrC family sensor kinase
LAYNFRGLFPAMRRQIGWPRQFPGSALVLASFLLPLGLFVVDATRSYNRAIEDGERHIASTATIFEEHAHNTFETYQLVLSLLDENIHGRSWEELENSQSLRDYLAQLVHDHPQIGGLALLDAKGFIRVGTMPLPNPAPNFADRGYFIALRDHDRGTYIGERVHSRLERSDELNIVQRRTTADGTFDGVLAVGVRPATAFLDFWGKGPKGTNTALIRADGGVLARFPKPDVDLTTIRLNTPFVLEAISGNQIYRPATSQIDHVSRMVSFQQVSGFSRSSCSRHGPGPYPTPMAGGQGCSTLSTELPLEESIKSCESGSISVLIEGAGLIAT